MTLFEYFFADSRFKWKSHPMSKFIYIVFLLNIVLALMITEGRGIKSPPLINIREILLAKIRFVVIL